jgi:hypothetical protein
MMAMSALSVRHAGITLMMVARKPGHQGERAISRKTTARGMPGVSGVTVVTNACAFYHCARGCGRAERPAFPAPLIEEGGKFKSKTRAHRAARMRRCGLTSLPRLFENRIRVVFRPPAASRRGVPTA